MHMIISSGEFYKLGKQGFYDTIAFISFSFQWIDKLGGFTDLKTYFPFLCGNNGYLDFHRTFDLQININACQTVKTFIVF